MINEGWQIRGLKGINHLEQLLYILMPYFLIKRGGAFNSFIEVAAVVILIKITLEKKIVRIDKKCLILGIATPLVFLSSMLGRYFDEIAVERITDNFKFYIILLIFSQIEIKKKNLKYAGIVALLSIYIPIIKGINQWHEIGYRFARISSNYSNSQYVSILGIASLICVVCLTDKNIKKMFKLPILFTCILINFCLILSGTKMIWITVFLLILITIFMKNRKMTLPSIFMVILVLIFVVRSEELSKNRYVSRLKGIYRVEEVRSNLARIYMWEEAFEQFKNSPLRGKGYANYDYEAVRRHPEYKEYIDYETKKRKKNYRSLSNEDKAKIHAYIERDHAHNDTMELLATTGLSGVIVYMSYILSLFIVLVRNYRLERDDVKKNMYYIGILSMVFLQLYGLTDVTVYMGKVNQIQSILVGMSLSLIYAKSRMEPENILSKKK